jgi:hypothetical protein
MTRQNADYGAVDKAISYYLAFARGGAIMHPNVERRMREQARHPFIGRLDRRCERCGCSDHHPFHDVQNDGSGAPRPEQLHPDPRRYVIEEVVVSRKWLEEVHWLLLRMDGWSGHAYQAQRFLEDST